MTLHASLLNEHPDAISARNFQLIPESRRVLEPPPALEVSDPRHDWRGLGLWLRGTHEGSAARLAELARETEREPANLPRLLAYWSDATNSEPFELAALWQAIGAGSIRILDVFYTADRCYCVLTQAPNNKRRTPLSGRTLEILQRVLGGQSQKTVSIELNVSASAITRAMKTMLRGVGLACRPSAAPLLFSMAARAATGQLHAAARSSRFAWNGLDCHVLSAGRPDRSLGNPLSDAERAVARLLLEGRSHAEIAHARHTSTRTIANQVSAIFRRLNISGRGELMSFLLR
ncbi:MAG TPA: helix-turn-helix transcriptional regulator [Polyangiaceae bacterium]|jgi:DNA-binding NarL/FixJ family response regulator